MTRFVSIITYRDFLIALTEDGRVFRIWWDVASHELRYGEEFRIHAD